MDSGEDGWGRFLQVVGLGLRPESPTIPEGQLRIRRGSSDERRGPEITSTDGRVGAPRSIGIQLLAPPSSSPKLLRHPELLFQSATNMDAPHREVLGQLAV